jgi:hypothetical protein
MVIGRLNDANISISPELPDQLGGHRHARRSTTNDHDLVVAFPERARLATHTGSKANSGKDS